MYPQKQNVQIKHSYVQYNLSKARNKKYDEVNEEAKVSAL